MADVTVKRREEMESIWDGTVEKRKITTGAESVQLLGIGGTPGQATTPPDRRARGPTSL